MLNMNRHVFILAGIITLIALALYQVVTRVNLDIPREIEISKKNSNKENKYMFELKSPVFENNSLIPMKYTCGGENINPPLEISGVPNGTESLTLIMEDPDVPKDRVPEGLIVHWVKFNMPINNLIIEEGKEPAGVAGRAVRDSATYVGPCPPDREHRYFFKLYALDTVLSLAPGATKEEVEMAMEGHILEKTELIGRYDKKP